MRFNHLKRRDFITLLGGSPSQTWSWLLSSLLLLFFSVFNEFSPGSAEPSFLVGDHRVAGEIDRHHVKPRLRQRRDADLRKANPQQLLVHRDAQIPVIRVVVL